MNAWVGDRLRRFDQDLTTQRVRDAVGVVPESVRLLIGFLADGVKLTPGGRLPRVVVRAIQEHRPDWCPLATTRSSWSPGPSARSLLPRATLVAELL